MKGSSMKSIRWTTLALLAGLGATPAMAQSALVTKGEYTPWWEHKVLPDPL
jgi:hypothetical protein